MFSLVQGDMGDFIPRLPERPSLAEWVWKILSAIPRNLMYAMPGMVCGEVYSNLYTASYIICGSLGGCITIALGHQLKKYWEID